MDVALLVTDTARTVASVGPKQRVDRVTVQRPPRDKDRWPLFPNVALAIVWEIVWEITKFRKGVIAFVLWRIRLSMTTPREKMQA